MKFRDPNTCKDNRYFDMTILFINKVCPFISVFIGCHSFIYPEWPTYLTTLFDEGTLPFSIRILFSLLVIYIILGCWAILQILLLFLLTNFCYTWEILKEFACQDGRSWSKHTFAHQHASAGFRSFANIRFHYTQLEILQICFLDIFGVLYVPVNIIATNLALFCNYTLIKRWEELDAAGATILIIWSTLSFIGPPMIYGIVGSLRNLGVKVLLSMKDADWGSKSQNVQMKKYVKGCDPLNYGLGKMFVIKRSTVLVFVRTVSRGTFRTLLAL